MDRQAAAPLNVLFVAAEVAPFTRLGPVGDAVAALPRALVSLGVKCTIVMPRYRSVDPERFSLARRLRKLEVPFGAQTRSLDLYEGKLPGSNVPVYLLDDPMFSGRDGVYGEGGQDYPDNVERFALLSRGAIELAKELAAHPDVIHTHDWSAALVPVYLEQQEETPQKPSPATVFTIHDLSAQGIAPRDLLPKVGLPAQLFSPEHLEFYGKLNCMKGGIVFSDRVTTTSPRYAQQICTSKEDGRGLEGLLTWSRPKLCGIVHGADHDTWDPARDKHLTEHYTAADLVGKGACKEALQAALGLPLRPDVPLLGAALPAGDASLDALVELGEQLQALDVQLAICTVGRGSDALRALAEKLPTQVAVRSGADDALLHRLVAGVDLWMSASPVDPSGVATLIAMRYGAVPVAQATAALDDTLVDYDRHTRTGTGFKFEGQSSSALLGAVHRAAGVYRAEGHFRRLQRSTMTQDLSWHSTAMRYLEVYRDAVRTARG